MKQVPPVAVFISVILFVLCHVANGQTGMTYDIVLTGGRVIDPETKLDAIKNVGITGNRIAQISSMPLKGKQEIDVAGLVVAPGFIDLHIHGRTNVEQQYQLHDGVTTALELEWGIDNLPQWYANRKAKALINYGASVCFPYERMKALKKYSAVVSLLEQKMATNETTIDTLFKFLRPSYSDTLTADEMSGLLTNIRNTLAEGAIGIGVPIGYLPKTDATEMFRVYQLAGELKALVFSHVRNPDMLSIQEVMADAVVTGAPLHVVHLTSMALGKIELALDMIGAAQKKGFDITTEVYPFTAGNTAINSAMFDEGWQDKLGIDYKDLQWVATGERLTKENFDEYRQKGGLVIMHMMKPEWVKAGIAAPGVMIGSDGGTYAKLAHPRMSGTFSRVLGKYVREEKVIDLNTALEKMTLLPAKRLEDIAPMMRKKGRLQGGADADITIFNPDTIKDKGTFETGPAFSEGIEHVIVNGVFVLQGGKSVSDVFPGKPVYGKFKK